ncbi:uncharacterized protein LOC102804358 [Saccoglossus kowalevskii]|uniref:Uncharacterized protein LOC102804358 n=1 Tax=Saccoglossus kowalevskii TaxID=10224 RepID=A0ABM0MVJ4_SACKO|nr:PREDICTED: uncharacterized protein LOC102804358 [Saccoglossus kowalevskii]
MGGEQSREETRYVSDDKKLQDAIDKERERLKEEKYRREKERQTKKLEAYLEKQIPKLQNYEFGNSLGKDAFSSIPCSDMKVIKIVVFGPTGAGKSCFINMVQHVVEGRSFEQCNAQTQSTGKEGTIHLESHLNNYNFRLLDTRGFFEERTYMSELDSILSGGIKVDELIKRDTDNMQGRVSPTASQVSSLADRVHGLICVLDYDDPRFNMYNDRMKEYRKQFKKEGYSPVSVVVYKSHGDIPDEEAKERTAEAASAIGSPIDRTFILRNHIASSEKEVTVPSKVALIQALETALIGAEMYVKIKKLADTKNRKKTDMTLDKFLKEARARHGWKDDDVTNIKETFNKNDIYDLASLKLFWPDIKDDVKKWGVRLFLGKELERTDVH